MRMTMAIPFLYKKRERHTLVSVCRTGERTTFCVNILDGRLAKELADSNIFVLKNGSVQEGHQQPSDHSPLQQTRKYVLQEYVDRNKFCD